MDPWVFSMKILDTSSYNSLVSTPDRFRVMSVTLTSSSRDTERLLSGRACPLLPTTRMLAAVLSIVRSALDDSRAIPGPATTCQCPKELDDSAIDSTGQDEWYPLQPHRSRLYDFGLVYNLSAP